MSRVARSDGHFKRQIVFRIGPDDWPLLERAAADHGSIQAAVLAGLHALTPVLQFDPAGEDSADDRVDRQTPTPATKTQDPRPVGEEISAREAAAILGLKTSTVSGYIRTGRLPGRYDPTRLQGGWITTRRAVREYLRGGIASAR